MNFETLPHDITSLPHPSASMVEMMFEANGMGDMFELAHPACATTLDLWRIRLEHESANVEAAFLRDPGGDNAELIESLSPSSPNLASWARSQLPWSLDIDLGRLSWELTERPTYPDFERYRFVAGGGKIVESTTKLDDALLPAAAADDGMDLSAIPAQHVYVRFSAGTRGLRVHIDGDIDAYFTGVYLRRVGRSARPGCWVTPTVQFSTYQHQYDVVFGTWFLPVVVGQSVQSSLAELLESRSIRPHAAQLDDALLATLTHASGVCRVLRGSGRPEGASSLSRLPMGRLMTGHDVLTVDDRRSQSRNVG